MLTTFCNLDGSGFHALQDRPLDALWIDLKEPTREEEQHIEQALSIQVPTRDEMREIESSSNLFREDGATFVIIRVVERNAAGAARVASITLVLTKEHFLTIRYGESKSFSLFQARMAKTKERISPLSALLLLLESVVDRDADILEEVSDRLENISTEIFKQNAANMESIAAANLGGVLTRIGECGELDSRVRQSLHSIGRAIPFLSTEDAPDCRARLKTLARDVQSLLDHGGFLENQVAFLLDSCVGLISIQQNAIMKTLSIATVVFLPPTLIAGIFGMNFEHMPLLHTLRGFEYALIVMVVTASAPLIFFRMKRWF